MGRRGRGFEPHQVHHLKAKSKSQISKFQINHKFQGSTPLFPQESAPTGRRGRGFEPHQVHHLKAKSKFQINLKFQGSTALFSTGERSDGSERSWVRAPSGPPIMKFGTVPNSGLRFPNLSCPWSSLILLFKRVQPVFRMVSYRKKFCPQSSSRAKYAPVARPVCFNDTVSLYAAVNEPSSRIARA